MNYYSARQVDPNTDRPDAGKWRYTRRNDGRIWPVGYCTDCPGHDTREEAYEHQTAYLLDHIFFDGELVDTKHPCAVDGCQEWTDRFAEVDRPGRMFMLCDQHRNRDTVAALFGGAGNSISSW